VGVGVDEFHREKLENRNWKIDRGYRRAVPVRRDQEGRASPAPTKMGSKSATTGARLF
jgi:hypothetical protein